MSTAYEAYLAHHGVKGQKWGIRRYQNDDGTLTELGRERYGGQKEYADNKVRKILGGDFGQEWASLKGDARVEKRLAKFEAEGNWEKAQKERTIKEGRDAARANRDAYRRHTSTAKLIAQNAILGINAPQYRHARAAGERRAEAFLESTNLNLYGVPVTSIYVQERDQQRYGTRYAAHSDM